MPEKLSLEKIAENLINFLDDEPLSFKSQNHLAYMALCFFYKQRQHLISLLSLNDNPDSQLICRTMIEGVIYLYEAKQNPVKSQDWRIFTNIENLRLLKIKKDQGFEVDSKTENEIKSAQIPSQLLKSKSKKDIEQKNRCPEYEDFEFVFKSIKKTAFKNDLQHLYDMYDQFSKWQHWNVFSVQEFISIKNNELTIQENFYRNDLVQIMGALCLLHIIQMIDEIFSLKKEKIIEKYGEQIMKFLEIRNNLN